MISLSFHFSWTFHKMTSHENHCLPWLFLRPLTINNMHKGRNTIPLVRCLKCLGGWSPSKKCAPPFSQKYCDATKGDKQFLKVSLGLMQTNVFSLFDMALTMEIQIKSSILIWEWCLSNLKKSLSNQKKNSKKDLSKII